MAEFEGRSGEGMHEREPGPGLDSVTEAVGALSQGMNALVRGHLALARVEIVRDLKALGRDAAMQAFGVPMLLASYLLLWFGIAFALALAIPAWASFLICSAFNLLVAAGLMAFGYAKIKKDKLALPASTDEVKRDRAWATQLRQSTSLSRRELH